MCGINGIYNANGLENGQALIQPMNDAIAHRGPNSDGVFTDQQQVALGHRRLSIIDLSDAGQQPFFSSDKNLVMVFNGEVYNFQEIKAEIGDYPYQSGTDTEVILAAYQKWGKDCLKKFNGMFAFAVWNKQTEELFLVRDRLGIKPLYYYQKDKQLVFSSEIRGLLASGIVPKKLSQEGLVDYLRYQTVHAPNSILQDVKMLPPAHFMHIKEGAVQIGSYWNAKEDYEHNLPTSYEAVKSEVKNRFFKAVERRLVADVPFGAFLSGGIDSSAVVGAMSQISSLPVRTFSVTFDEAEFSEAKFAQMVADKFNTEHTEIRLTPDYFLEELPLALASIDHPSGDGPNSYIVSKVTKQAGVTMALSGLGGDELFAGYDVFKRVLSLQSKQWLGKVPSAFRQLAGWGLQKARPSVASDKIASLLQQGDLGITGAYPITRQVLLENSIKALLTFSGLPENAVSQKAKAHRFNGLPILSQVSVLEMETYMQNVLLRDTDQMSMASALEVRVPFLDHELVELALGISDQFKYPATPKKLLIESLGDLLPSEVVNRPKMGFTLPWATWLKTTLKDFAQERLESLAGRSAFQEKALLDLWSAFLQGNPSVTWSRLWPLIVLEDWMQKHGIEI